jgi:hypothetical protein
VRLVGLLARDDEETGGRVMEALIARGPNVAVGHLATALDRGVGDPRLRRRILFALESLARDPRAAWQVHARWPTGCSASRIGTPSR